MKRDEAWFAEYNAKRARWTTCGNLDFKDVPVVQPSRRITTTPDAANRKAADGHSLTGQTSGTLNTPEGASGVNLADVESLGAGSARANRAEAQGAHARATAPVPIPYERDVLSAVLDYLKVCPRVAWFARMNSGGMTDKNGQYVKFAFTGCSDIIGQLKDGRFLAIECKRPGKNATPDQWQFLCNVNRANGVAFVATSVDDVRSALG